VKRKREKTTQIGPRLSASALSLLEELQDLYAKRIGLQHPLSQPQALEIIIHEAANREGLHLKAGPKPRRDT